jgi:hypothetical protein
MPAQPFTVHVDPDALARPTLAAVVPRPSVAARDDRAGAAPDTRHGARDARAAADQRSKRERAGRAAGAATGRSYAFRRS